MKKYSIGGIAIGIIQVIEAVISYLYAENDDCISPWIPFFVLEFLWTIVSLVVAIRVKYLLSRLLALAFITYEVFRWILGAFLTDTAVVPILFVALHGIFGLIYATSSVYVAKQP